MKLFLPIFTPGLCSVAAASLLQIAQAASRSLFVCLALAPALQAQALDPQAEFQAQSRPHLETLPSGEKSLQWTGQTGQTYFLQSSTDLSSWTWLPTIQSGVTATMSNPVSSTAPANFFRLVRTNKTAVNPYTADFDGDGLSNLEEITARPRPGGTAGYPDLNPNIQTSPLDKDTDHDGTTDDVEQDLNTDPTDDGTRDIKNAPQGDLDGDGVSNSEEQLANTDPKNSNDFPVQVFIISKDCGGMSRSTENRRTGQITWRANWSNDDHEDLSGLDATPSNLLSKLNELPFPSLPPAQISKERGDGQVPLGIYRGSRGSGTVQYFSNQFANQIYPNSTSYYALLITQRIWLKAPISTHDQRFDFLRQKTKNTRDGISGIRTFEYISSEAITIVIPAGKTYSAPLDFEAVPAVIEQSDMSSSAVDTLLRSEKAPEVLSVNSDFDEGRIDPVTGYAIPDCDDMPGVDPETGAGNTKLELGAVRSHLDGTFAQGDLVVKDLHKGWFGMTPTKYSQYDFHEGANITLRKVDKIDADISYKESGQVRFYAKWNGGYYGISPYDFRTLQPVNLVSGGVNGRPGEGIYGTSSTIPDNAEFYMEGVRPGKITLEWRYQKGSTDFKFEQTFKVETRKTRDKWREEVVYQIRLQTKVKSGTEVDLRTYDPNLGFYGDLGDQTSKVRAIYYYYRQLFQQMPEKLMWAGMAKVAAAPIYAGMSDLTEWYHSSEITPGTGFGTRDPGTRTFINNLLLSGQKRIFEDMAWTHRAYQASGIWAIKETVILENPRITDLAAWRQIDKGIQENLQSEINGGNKELLRREQRVVVQNDYSAISTVFLRQPPALLTWWVNGVTIPVNSAGLANAGEWLSANANKNPLNPQLPYGPKFRTTVPGGRLDLYADRWAWTSNPIDGMLEMWTGESTGGVNFSAAKRMSNNNLSMKQSASVYTNSNSSMLPND
jgi:hypothetical protein